MIDEFKDLMAISMSLLFIPFFIDAGLPGDWYCGVELLLPDDWTHVHQITSQS